MHVIEYLISTVLVGVVTAYSYIIGAIAQSAPAFQPADFLGPMAALALSIAAVIGLAKTLRYVYTRLQESTDKRIADKDREIERLTAEVSRLWQEKHGKN